MAHILIIDDNDNDQTFMRLALEKAGYTCTCISTKKETIKILQSRKRFSAALLD